jgi:hypothetical protein
MVISLIVSSEADAILGPSLCKQMSSFTHDQTIQERIYNQLDGRRHQPVRGHQEEEPTHPSVGELEVEAVSSAVSSSVCDKAARLIGTVRCLTDPSSRDLNWLSGSKAVRDQQLLRLSVPFLRYLPHLPHLTIMTTLYSIPEHPVVIYCTYANKINGRYICCIDPHVGCWMSSGPISEIADCFRREGKLKVTSSLQLDLLSSQIAATS